MGILRDIKKGVETLTRYPVPPSRRLRSSSPASLRSRHSTCSHVCYTSPYMSMEVSMEGSMEGSTESLMKCSMEGSMPATNLRTCCCTHVETCVHAFPCARTGHMIYWTYSYGPIQLCPYTYGPIHLWPYTVMALYSHGPV